jgi:hypothetical protein
LRTLAGGRAQTGLRRVLLSVEFGICVALGAGKEKVLQLILSDGMRPALVGLAVGVAVSIETAHLLGKMLYRTRALDPVVYSSLCRSITLPDSCVARFSP